MNQELLSMYGPLALVTGATPWMGARQYYIRTGQPSFNSNFGVSEFPLGPDEIVPVGARKTFAFNVTAPAIPGTYTFTWVTHTDEIGTFGDFSTPIAVAVT